MLNDPLLETPATSGATGSTPKRRAKRPSPATSAKILATGLATTAMLGMSAGYALASHDKAETPDTEVAPNNLSTIAAPDETMAPAPQTVPAPAVTTPAVIEIPVPDAAPAQPGNNWGNSGNNQTSSGSN